MGLITIKFLLPLLCCAALTLASREMFLQRKVECMSEMGVKEADVGMGNPTKEQKCVFKCVAEKAGFIDANGAPLPIPPTMAALSAEKQKVFQECMSIRKDDICDQSFEMAKCLEDKMDDVA